MAATTKAAGWRQDVAAQLGETERRWLLELDALEAPQGADRVFGVESDNTPEPAVEPSVVEPDESELQARVEQTIPFSLACAEYVHKYGISLAEIHGIAEAVAELPIERLRDILGGVALLYRVLAADNERLCDKLDMLAVQAAEEVYALGGKRPMTH